MSRRAVPNIVSPCQFRRATSRAAKASASSEAPAGVASSTASRGRTMSPDSLESNQLPTASGSPEQLNGPLEQRDTTIAPDEVTGHLVDRQQRDAQRGMVVERTQRIAGNSAER